MCSAVFRRVPVTSLPVETDLPAEMTQQRR